MRILAFGGGLIVLALATLAGPKMTAPVGEPVVIPEGERIPKPKDRRGERMPSRCTKSERMARLQANQKRQRRHSRSG